MPWHHVHLISSEGFQARCSKGWRQLCYLDLLGCIERTQKRYALQPCKFCGGFCVEVCPILQRAWCPEDFGCGGRGLRGSCWTLYIDCTWSNLSGLWFPHIQRFWLRVTSMYEALWSDILNIAGFVFSVRPWCSCEGKIGPERRESFFGAPTVGDASLGWILLQFALPLMPLKKCEKMRCDHIVTIVHILCIVRPLSTGLEAPQVHCFPTPEIGMWQHGMTFNWFQLVSIVNSLNSGPGWWQHHQTSYNIHQLVDVVVAPCGSVCFEVLTLQRPRFRRLSTGWAQLADSVSAT